MNMIDQIHAAGIADGFNNPNIGPYCIQQSPAEFAQLVEILKGYPLKSYLQVGSAAGGTERFICEQTGIKTLHIIDLGEHPEFHVWREVNRPALEAQGVTITEHLGDSHDEAAEEFLAHHGLKYDLIGIDGDHTPAGVRMDWKLVSPCLRPGTLCWFHDTNYKIMRSCDNGAWEVFSELAKRHKVLLDVRDVFGIGLVEIA